MITGILTWTLLAGGLTQNVGQAEHKHISGMLATGTGVSMAGRGGQALRARSPMFLNIEVPVRFDSVGWLEISPGIQLEMEGRVGLGLMPRFRAYVPLRRPRLYGIVGGLFYVYPYTLMGAQAGLGLNLDFHESFGLFVEVTAAAFFGGNDLMKDSGLGKIDGAAGFRVNF